MSAIPQLLAQLMGQMPQPSPFGGMFREDPFAGQAPPPISPFQGRVSVPEAADPTFAARARVGDELPGGGTIDRIMPAATGPLPAWMNQLTPEVQHGTPQTDPNWIGTGVRGMPYRFENGQLIEEPFPYSPDPPPVSSLTTALNRPEAPIAGAAAPIPASAIGSRAFDIGTRLGLTREGQGDAVAAQQPPPMPEDMVPQFSPKELATVKAWSQVQRDARNDDDRFDKLLTIRPNVQQTLGDRELQHLSPEAQRALRSIAIRSDPAYRNYVRSNVMRRDTGLQDALSGTPMHIRSEAQPLSRTQREKINKRISDRRQARKDAFAARREDMTPSQFGPIKAMRAEIQANPTGLAAILAMGGPEAIVAQGVAEEGEAALLRAETEAGTTYQMRVLLGQSLQAYAAAGVAPPEGFMEARLREIQDIDFPSPPLTGTLPPGIATPPIPSGPTAGPPPVPGVTVRPSLTPSEARDIFRRFPTFDSFVREYAKKLEIGGLGSVTARRQARIAWNAVNNQPPGVI